METDDSVGSRNDALFMMRKAATNDSVLAMAELAEIYEKGTIVTQSKLRAIYWYQRASKKGDDLSTFNLERMMKEYDPLEKEKTEFELEKNMRIAIENIDPIECQKIGDYYYYGTEDEKPDKSRSMKWYEEAINYGNDKAALNLGIIYETGEVVNKDPNKALEYFKKASVAGDPIAQNRLGELYEHGIGVEKNEKLAMKWYRRSAEQNYPKGQSNLSRCYEKGIGTDKDHDKAVMWRIICRKNEIEKRSERIQ